MAQTVIGVRFKRAGKIHFFDPGDDEIVVGDSVIVDTIRGLECGTVVIAPREMPEPEEPSPNRPETKKIHRKATRADMARVAENKENEKRAFDICLQKIKDHDLPMKLINVNYTFDVNKIIFYFTADGRVDFRALVRDLASVFHTRIELRQVGVRDEAKLLGGIGCCGRPLCCATFLGDFAPLSIRMAKEQNLSLNPTKISGICGRLLCCLKYESDYYHEMYKENAQNFIPEYGNRVMTAEGEGKVIHVNMQKQTVTVMLDTKDTISASWEDLLPIDEDNGETKKKFSRKSPEVSGREENPGEEKKSPAKFSSERPKKIFQSNRPKKIFAGEDKNEIFKESQAEVKNKNRVKYRDKQNNSGFKRPRRSRRPGDFRK